MPYAYPIQDWNKQFLRDINAPTTAQNLQFLQGWEQREGHGTTQDYGFNPLNTMQGGFGGHVQSGSAGIMDYPSMQQGAAANAAVLSGGGYPQLLSALQSGSPQFGNPYGGEVGKWSGGGYGGVPNLSGTGNLGGYVAQNRQQQTPQAIADFGQLVQTGVQGTLAQQLEMQNAAFAQQEAGFQNQNLGLSQQQLGIQRGQLRREEALLPYQQNLENQQRQLQMQALHRERADTTRQYGQQVRDITSSEAASGSLFTKGARDTFANLRADLASALASNTRSVRGLAAQQKEASANFLFQMQGLQDQSKNLDILSKRYGISKQEVAARLANQINNLKEGVLQDISGLASQSAQLLGDIGMQQIVPAPITGLTQSAPSSPLGAGVSAGGGGVGRRFT